MDVLSSREEQHFPRAVVWAGGTKLRAREFLLFLTGASNKPPLWGLITAWLRVSLLVWGVLGLLSQLIVRHQSS